MRRIEDKDIVGKTVAKIENESINVIRLIFVDGTILELWTEMGPYQIPIILVNDQPRLEGL